MELEVCAVCLVAISVRQNKHMQSTCTSHKPVDSVEMYYCTFGSVKAVNNAERSL